MQFKNPRTDQQSQKQSAEGRKANKRLEALEDPMVNTRMVFERYLKD